MQALTRRTHDSPIGQYSRAHCFIELDRGLIPIEHAPFEATALALHCNVCEMDEERFSIAFATMLGPDEQIFQVEPFATEKRGKVMKVKREADRGIPLARNHALRARLRTKQFAIKIGFVADHQMFEFFVHGKRTNEFNDRGEIVARGGQDRKVHPCILPKSGTLGAL